MAWRAANSLITLRDQLNATYPGWLFLGFLGDQAHAAVASDHNPNAQGVVCALDIGPGGGLAIHSLADRLLAVRHPDLKYLISNRRIAGDWTGWKWSQYNGSDPHDTHIHVSVGVGPDGQSKPPYDDTNKWNVKGDTMSADALTPQEAEVLYYVSYPNEPKNPEFIKSMTGKTASYALTWVKDDASRQNLVTGLVNDAAAYRANPSEYEPVKEQLFRKK